MFILVSGSAKVMVSKPNGKEAALATLGPGETIAEMSMLDGKPSSATVRAATPCEAIRVDGKSFCALMPPKDSAAHAILVGLARRLRQADVKIESLALVDVYGRVARALVDMAQEVNGELLIRGKVGRQDLAKQVGSSREMVSRIMSDLLAKGFLTQISDSMLQVHRNRLSKEY